MHIIFSNISKNTSIATTILYFLSICFIFVINCYLIDVFALILESVLFIIIIIFLQGRN